MAASRDNRVVLSVTWIMFFDRNCSRGSPVRDPDLLAVPVRVARMEDLPTDVAAGTAPVRKAACPAVVGPLWLDTLAAERAATARTLQTSRGALAMAALPSTADVPS